MTTKFVGLKELRQNMAKISSEALKKNQRLIVLRKNAPLFELRPLTKTDMARLRFAHELEEARASVRRGEVYTTAQVRKLLGLAA